MARPRKAAVAADAAAKELQNAITAEDLIAKFPDFPAIDILSRRFNDPSEPGSLPILLKGEDNACINTDHQRKMQKDAVNCHLCQKPNRKWYVRWTNTSKDGQWSKMRQLGYVPVAVDELLDQDDVADLVRGPLDKHVRRGDRGQEVLMKQPLLIRNHLKKLLEDKYRARSLSAEHFKEDLAAGVFGADSDLASGAGEMIHEGGIRVERMKRSKSTFSDEMGRE